MRPKCYCEYGSFIIFAENMNSGFTYLQQQEQAEFVKVFLSLSVCQLNYLRTSKCLSLGELIRLRRIYFPNTFALVLDSNLHDLNGTNPD